MSVHLLALLNIKQFSRAVINVPNVTQKQKNGREEENNRQKPSMGTEWPASVFKWYSEWVPFWNNGRWQSRVRSQTKPIEQVIHHEISALLQFRTKYLNLNSWISIGELIAFVNRITFFRLAPVLQFSATYLEIKFGNDKRRPQFVFAGLLNLIARQKSSVGDLTFGLFDVRYQTTSR